MSQGTLTSRSEPRTGEVVEALSIVGEVSAALGLIAEKNTQLIAEFGKAFSERAENASLDESKPNALPLVLASLLCRYPPESCFDPSRFQESENVLSDPVFSKEQFEAALTKVARKYPYALNFLRKNQKEKERSLSTLLRALLVFYIENKEVYPYF